MDYIYPKRVFPVWNGKSDHLHWILNVRISLGTKFHLKLKILIFWTKFAQNGYFWLKTENYEHPHLVLYIRINLGTKFQLKLTTLIFWTKFAQKRIFPLESRKNKLHYWILQVPNFSLKWQLCLWFFELNLSTKSISGSKWKKGTSPYFIEFWICELV